MFLRRDYGRASVVIGAMVLMRVLTVQLLKLVVLALFMKGDITVRIVCGVVEPGLFFFFFFSKSGGAVWSDLQCDAARVL